MDSTRCYEPSSTYKKAAWSGTTAHFRHMSTKKGNKKSIFRAKLIRRNEGFSLKHTLPWSSCQGSALWFSLKMKARVNVTHWFLKGRATYGRSEKTSGFLSFRCLAFIIKAKVWIKKWRAASIAQQVLTFLRSWKSRAAGTYCSQIVFGRFTRSTGPWLLESPLT